jgi:hypothetical protein
MAIRRQHQIFAEEFAISRDPIASYRRAYARASTTTARVNAARLLKRDDIAAEIERLRMPIREAANKKALVTAEWVVEKLKAEAERKDTTASARVSALKHLGDHLGLFQVLPPLKVLLAHVAGEFGQAAADLLKEALASAAARAKERQVAEVERGKPANPPEQVHGARPPAEAAHGQQASAGASQGSNQAAEHAGVPHHVTGEPERTSGPFPESGEITTVTKGTAGNAGPLLGSRPVSGQGRGAGAGNSEDTCGSADQDTPAPTRRPTTEADVQGMKCRAGYLPRHGTTADLD